jgi:hypothetical protein
LRPFAEAFPPLSQIDLPDDFFRVAGTVAHRLLMLRLADAPIRGKPSCTSIGLIAMATPLHVDQLLGGGGALRLIAGGIAEDDVEFSPLHAALGVDIVEIRQRRRS